ncbi:6-carboxytetrahydropterin synthase QueD [Candidatus Altiarchaeota archaeon]
MRAARIFYFDAAHHLPDYQGKCEHVHGHTYRLEVVIASDVGADGMVMDFNDIKKIVIESIVDRLDHMDLNELMDNPTAESIASWIWENLSGKLPLSRIRLWEGDRKWVEKTSED